MERDLHRWIRRDLAGEPMWFHNAPRPAPGSHRGKASSRCRRFCLSVIRRSNLWALALLMVAATLVCAQEYSFRSFGVSDGLNNLAVRRIYQDRAGFLWVSTENGIFRYDGERFESFGPAQGIPPTSSAAFGEAPDGSLLAGGDFGLYQLSGNRFKKVPADFSTINWAQGIQADGKGHTFLATNVGLVEMVSNAGHNGFDFHRLPQPAGTSGPEVGSVLVDGAILWYGCGQELCRLEGKETRVFGKESGLPGRALLTIQKDRAGRLWVRARNFGIFVWSAAKSKFERPQLPYPPENLGGVANTDDEGRILLPSPEGLLIQNETGWQTIGRSMGLRGTVYAAFEDRQHNLWIGLAGRGLAQWRGYREWESYSAASGLASDLVYEILPRADGSLWVATEAGLFRGERKQSGMEFRMVPGMGGFPVHSLQMDPNGSLWAGTETRGVARLTPATGKVEWFGEAQGLTGKAAYTLRFDRQHQLWAATEVGLFLSEAPYHRFSRIAELPSTRIWAVAEGTDGTLWAGGLGGLFELAGGHWTNLKQADGLSNQEVLSLGAGPDGVVWVGYRHGGGIDRVQPRAGGVAVEKGVQRPGSDGLVYFLDFDSHGRLWAGTERGVDMWDGARWSHYDVNDGLAWDDCNLNGFAEEPDGTVWIGTSGGLSRFKPRPRSTPDAPLEVVFTRLTMGQIDVSGLQDPSFGAHANSLIVRYSVLNSLRQNGVVFRYRVGGENSAWTETTQRELHFANLAPGNYRLEIQARESDGPWGGHSVHFPFRVLTPWYERWWFISVCVLIPLFVVVAALRLRMLSAHRREQELVRIVEEKTADLRLANEELRRLSFTDPLTGLANRRVFDQTLTRECARLQRTGSPVSLLSIDADHFKALNDSEGHQRGDECLFLLAAELTRMCRRRTDLAARCGGEEFAVILPDTDVAEAERFAELVRLAIAGLKLPHPASPTAPFLTVSIGVAFAKWPCKPEELIAAADRALYAAKKGGRNRVSVALPPSTPQRT